MLQSSLAPRRIEERWDATRETLEREGVRATEVHGWGRSAFSHMLSLIHFGDYVSYYLAMLNQVDPTPVESIAFLKRRLAELGEVAS
jgi:glucose/mannose-6-phosphate isomerase